MSFVDELAKRMVNEGKKCACTFASLRRASEQVVNITKPALKSGSVDSSVDRTRTDSLKDSN